MRMSLHKLYINTLMYMYTYFRCKNPFINLGMKRCNGHCSVGPASLPIGQVHGGSLFVTDAGGVWAWGVEMWKVWKSMDLSDSRLKRLDASHDSQYTYIYDTVYIFMWWSGKRKFHGMIIVNFGSCQNHEEIDLSTLLMVFSRPGKRQKQIESSTLAVCFSSFEKNTLRWSQFLWWLRSDARAASRTSSSVQSQG